MFVINRPLLTKVVLNKRPIKTCHLDALSRISFCWGRWYIENNLNRDNVDNVRQKWS